MIELKDISVSFGQRNILNGISATVAEGAITAVMGPNGCGKTTLLRCIGGLLQPQGGQVILDNRRVDDYSARALAQRLAFVRQQSQTDFDFTAFEIVLMGRNPWQGRLQSESDEDLAIVERCMRQTGTWHLRQSTPAQMSGGELQRVMIARALAQQTPLLLMDEPVSNLDIAHQIEVMRLMRENGRTVIVVLHDLNLALRFCDRLLLLHQGRLLFDGAMAEGLTPQNISTVYGVNSHMADGHVVLDY